MCFEGKKVLDVLLILYFQSRKERLNIRVYISIFFAALPLKKMWGLGQIFYLKTFWTDFLCLKKNPPKISKKICREKHVYTTNKDPYGKKN